MKDKPVEREKLYAEIKKVYENGKEMTARECAEVLFKKRIVPYPLRQCAAPRLTELCKMNQFKTVGSKFDETTNKTVTVYRMVENG